MAHGPVITLSIQTAGAPPDGGFRFHVEVDGEVVAAERSLTAHEARSVSEFARQYLALFEGRRAPNVAAADLSAVGTGLFKLWFEDAWPKVAARLAAAGSCLLVVASDAADALNLPWDLVRLPDGDFLGIDGRFSVRRLPWASRRLQAFEGQLRPRPLRLLFAACAPRGEAELDYEREEEYLLKAIAGAGPNVTFDSADLGTFEELRQRINDFKPHVVHLTGHGMVDDDGLGYFAFEDERGGPDPRPAQEIARDLFGAGSGVQCVFVSGCRSAQAPPVSALGGVCQGLLTGGVPLAVGFAASVADEVATPFAATFYNTLAAGQPVDRALLQARQAIFRRDKEEGDPSWTLPVLYASTTQGPVYDPDLRRAPEPAPRASMVQQALPGMTEGYAESFVGRRREQQRLLPALREGQVQTLIITGLGGVGKSALATRLARKLQTEGFAPIVAPSSAETPLSVAGLLQACGDAFLDAGLRNEHATVREATLSVDDRLRYVVGVLNKHRFLLVLDNFETNLDEGTRRILSAELAGFYRHLLANLSGDSRAIITSRYLPADIPELPATAREEPLGDLSEASFIKFLLRDPKVERRYYAGKLPSDLLAELHRLLGGTPRFLGQVRGVLRATTAHELRRELAAVQMPAGGDAGALQAIRDRYCESIFTARLYGYLDADARRALSRAAAYGVAVNMHALAAVTGETPDRLQAFAGQWHERALAYPDRDRAVGELWAVYGPVRAWLMAQLGPDERCAVHRAAGDYLRDLEGQDRERELGLSWVPCLLEARAQYLAAGDYERARGATDRLSGTLVRHGVYEELVWLNSELLEHEEHPGPMSWIARAQADRGDYGSARKWYQRCLDAAADHVPEEAAVAWHGLATIDLRQGDYAAAWEKFEKSVRIKQEIGNRTGEAATWHQLATIDLRQGDYAAAWEKFEKALRIKQEIGNRAGEAATWHQLALIDAYQGDYAAAREKSEKSLGIEQEIGSRAGEAASWHELATIDLAQGDYAAAREKFEKSLRIEQEIGNRAGEAATWAQLGLMDIHAGDYDAARNKYRRALQSLREIGDRAGEAATFYQLGFLAAKMGRLLEGARLVAVCFVIDQAIGHGDAQRDFAALSGLLGQLNYAADQVPALLQEVSQAYRDDRGRGLIEDAFKGL